MIEPILIIAIVIACTAWYIQYRRKKRIRFLALQHTSGLELLAKRYARGDIDREEYLQMKADILDHQAVATASLNTPRSRAA